MHGAQEWPLDVDCPFMDYSSTASTPILWRWGTTASRRKFSVFTSSFGRKLNSIIFVGIRNADLILFKNCCPQFAHKLKFVIFFCCKCVNAERSI